MGYSMGNPGRLGPTKVPMQPWPTYVESVGGDSREVIYRKLPVPGVALSIGQSRVCGNVMCNERARESQRVEPSEHSRKSPHESAKSLPTYCREPCHPGEHPEQPRRSRWGRDVRTISSP
ncbi:hypothetical protein KM043_016587 [Ampulex compressa]|nr:hypothetical protein KM043_016587 [Ampulex compressa]